MTPKGNSLSIEQYNASDISSNEDICNSQMSSIVCEDHATYLESKPVTPKGNSSNEDRCNSQMSSIVSEDLDTYLGNDMDWSRSPTPNNREQDITEHGDIELKSDTDISIGESEHLEYAPSKDELNMIDSDEHSDEDSSPKPQKKKKL